MLELRASKIGGCVRGYIMDLRSGKEPEPTDRAKLYFAVGKALEPVIMKHAGYDPKSLLKDKFEVRVKVNEEVVLVGHPDAYPDRWILECKTMRSYAYQKILKTSFFVEAPQYLIQGSVYVKGAEAEGVIFLCLDKDASLINKVTVAAWELEEYFKQAEANTEKILRWLGKKLLPGKDPALPKYHCYPTYCLRHNCRYNYINREPYPHSMKRRYFNYKPDYGTPST